MDEVKDEVQRPLSVEEIFNIAKKSCNVIPYSDMFQIINIDDLFERNPLFSIDSEYPFDDNSCIILYLTSNNYGHWCILNRNEDRYDFLDSYGELLDDQLNHINEKYRNTSHQDENYLTTLLYESINNKLGGNKEVHYNDIRLQMLNDKIATCGRYVALFLKYNYMPVEEFAETLAEKSEENGIPLDMLVTLMTL